MIRRLLCSGVSQRRVARILNLNRKTVVRKFLFLAKQTEAKFARSNLACAKANVIEFDDQETFEHTKCKPLSITMALESGSRRILGFEVSRMPAKGHLAKISRLKYGIRSDERPRARRNLFLKLTPLVTTGALIKSDQSPHYPKDVEKYFPLCEHKTFKGRRGCVVGQGELKKIGFDPLFSLNHTFAKFRSDINRLARRTWCTTKKPEHLRNHLMIYVDYHNEFIRAVA